MSGNITGKEYPLAKIFGSDFEYHIPAYQRPYAWSESETNALFDDLYDFMQSEKSDSFFMGSIVLIKEDNIPRCDVIDGQQRLTTLSILIAVLSYSFKDPKRKDLCLNLLQNPGNELTGEEAKPRLFLRPSDQPFFNKYIQEVDIVGLLALDPEKLSEVARHIQKNCKSLVDRFSVSFTNDDQLVKFSQFLLNRCFLIAVATPNQESAFRIFSVMNSRGLPLLPTDIIKAETIGKLPASSQQNYTNIWEDLENSVGREGFNEVFTHTRTIFAKERPRKNLLDEFKEYVISRTTPQELIDKYLSPYTDAYRQLRTCGYASTKNADEINKLLFWLNKTGNYDWMPPAIKFYTDHANESDYILWFTRKLERLASYLMITAKDVNHRMDRYKWILVEMEDSANTSIDSPLKTIDLTDYEKQQFMNALGGEIYTMPWQRRTYILQRLDSFVSDGGATYNTRLFTIEHVLPQHPASDSEWMKLWPDQEQQKYWLNRIANLVPLTRQRSSAAQNYDFATKKEKYFKSKAGTSSYALTTQVISEDQWTPAVVENRQQYLLSLLEKEWDLKVDASNQNETAVDFKIAGRGASGKGYPANDGDSFIVKKGTRISPDTAESLQATYRNMRDQLIQNNVIVNKVFVDDYQFESPSAAAAVVLGRSANGRTEWTRLDGRTVAQSGH